MSEAIGFRRRRPPRRRTRCCPASRASPQATQELIDAEVRRIVDEAPTRRTLLLTEHRDKLESLTRALLAAETLDQVEAYAAAGIDRRGAPAPVRAAAAPRPCIARLQGGMEAVLDM